MTSGNRQTWRIALCAFATAASLALAQPLGWKQVPGAANDIGVGPKGEAWVIGTDKGGNDYGIYRLDGANWTKVPGGAVRIDVGPAGPWVVNSGGGIYRWNGSAWDHMPGAAKDVGIGANGAVWVIGTNAEGGGFGIYRWVNNNWEKVPGSAVRIDVDPQGNAWVVNNAKNIYRWNGSAWQQMPGAALDIGIGANGAVYVVGTDNGVWQWNGKDNWIKRDGLLTDISVDHQGNPWGVNASRQIWASAGGGAAPPPPPPAGAVPAFVKQFAPVLVFASGSEPYGYPMSAQKFFEAMKNSGTTWPFENKDKASLANGSIPTYYQVRTVGKQTRIRYWFFYGYQHPCFAKEGLHHGDWENVIVILKEDRSGIAAVRFAQHDAYYTRISGPRDAPCTPAGIGRCGGSGGFERRGAQPVAYVGRIAHGSYHNTYAGLPSAGACTYYGDARGGGPTMNTALNLVDLDGNAEAWLAEDRKGGFMWGPDGVSTHPTVAPPEGALQACKGSPAYDFGSAASAYKQGPGCFYNECLSGDDQAAERCIKECQSGYTNVGLTCNKGKWPWEWSVYGRLDSGRWYHYGYNLPTTDAGLTRRRQGGEWNLP